MKKHKVIIRLISISLLIIFIIFSFYDFIHQTNILNTNKTLDHLQDVGKQTANIYHEKFIKFQNTISSTCDLIGENFYSKEDIGNILDNIRTDDNLFDRLWYIDQDKKLYNYKTNEVINSSGDYIKSIFEGKTGISDVFTTEYNQKNVISIYAPVYRHQQIIGGVSGIIEINDNNKDYIYGDIFKSEAYVFTTTCKGEIISKIDNKNSLYSGENYLDYLNQDVTFIKSNYKEVIENMNQNESGFMTYSYQGHERMVYYTPAQINKWYVFTIISDKIVNQQNNQFNEITSLLIIKLTIVFFIIIILTIRYFIKINKMRQNINNDLVKSNKKIEMILKQTSDRMFEYDILNDSLILNAWNDFPKVIFNNFKKNLFNYNFVSKEHEQLLIDKIEEMINGKDKNMLDAKFPYISKDEDTWFHVSMLKENNTIIGILRNSTKEMNEYNILLQDQMFKNSVYSHAIFMFAANLKENKVLIYQKDGEYHNVIDVHYANEFLDQFMKTIHFDDMQRAVHFFCYEHIQNIHHNNENNKIELRQFNLKNNTYQWVRYRIQFEKQSHNSQLLMIAYCININEEKSQQLEYEFKAQRDGLTGLYNRQTFNQLVNNYLKERKSNDYSAYLIIDLDNFKSINDSLGHTQGDIAIQKVAEILQNMSNQNSIIGRYGGDEFIMFLYDQKSYDYIEEQFIYILRTIEKIEIDHIHDLTASIGVVFVKDEKNYDELFDKCDQALYVCKNSGKNRYYIYTEDTHLS